jgi:hypothetical protein
MPTYEFPVEPMEGMLLPRRAAIRQAIGAGTWPVKINPGVRPTICLSVIILQQVAKTDRHVQAKQGDAWKSGVRSMPAE